MTLPSTLHETPAQVQGLEELLALVGGTFHEMKRELSLFAKLDFHLKSEAASSAKSDAQTLGGNDGASVCSTKINIKTKTSVMKFGSMISFGLAQVRLDILVTLFICMNYKMRHDGSPLYGQDFKSLLFN